MTNKMDDASERLVLRAALSAAFEKNLPISEALKIARKHFDEKTTATAQTEDTFSV